MSGARKSDPGKRAGYHHGRLREAMVEAAVALIEEVGPYAVTVREVARRAGVSPGAPFRHFPSRAALLTAVAEEAMRRFQAEIATALGAVAGADVRTRMMTVARAYLAWAIRNPTHFKVISNRDLIDYAGSSTLMGINAQTHALLHSLFTEAHAAGELRGDDVDGYVLLARATVYGLARMAADGHLPSTDDARRQVEPALALFMAGVLEIQEANHKAREDHKGRFTPTSSEGSWRLAGVQSAPLVCFVCLVVNLLLTPARSARTAPAPRPKRGPFRGGGR